MAALSYSINRVRLRSVPSERRANSDVVGLNIGFFVLSEFFGTQNSEAAVALA